MNMGDPLTHTALLYRVRYQCADTDVLCTGTNALAHCERRNTLCGSHPAAMRRSPAAGSWHMSVSLAEAAHWCTPLSANAILTNSDPPVRGVLRSGGTQRIRHHQVACLGPQHARWDQSDHVDARRAGAPLCGAGAHVQVEERPPDLRSDTVMASL